MRFTRPGACPRHVPCLESTQLRRSVFGPRIDDECPSAELRAGHVLDPIPAAIGWIELDVKVMVRATAPRWLLVHCHHVGERNLEEAVIFLKHALQDPGERFAVLRVKVEQTGPMPQRSDMHLVRPPGKWRYERYPVLVAQNCALPTALSHEHIAVDAASGLSFVPR